MQSLQMNRGCTHMVHGHFYKSVINRLGLLVTLFI